MRISQRANSVQPSLTRQLFNMAKNYDDVIDLTLGDPDLHTPDRIKQAGCRAILQDKTKYSANAGLMEARAAVAKHVNRVWNVPCDPEKNLIVTVGGMEALFLALSCLVDEGDEVIIFAPYYVNYVQMVYMCGGKPVIIESYSDTHGMVIDAEAIRKAVTDRTVAIIVNSPNNPTGSLLSKQDLKSILEIAQDSDLAVISDEVYRTLVYDENCHESILQFPGACERTVLIDSLSKEYCMTGWRVGYAYAPEELVKNMVKLQENVASCASLPSQYAMIEAYSGQDNDDGAVLEVFQKRCDFLYQALCEIPGVHCVKPKGTFYLFLNIEKTGLQSYDFASQLLQQEHVAVVPGESYGAHYTNYVRIAFTKDITALEKAVERISRFVLGKQNTKE